MTDREILELVLQKVTTMDTKISTMETDISTIKSTVETIRGEVAGLAEFKTETTQILGRHELDIQLLKKVAAS